MFFTSTMYEMLILEHHLFGGERKTQQCWWASVFKQKLFLRGHFYKFIK